MGLLCLVQPTEILGQTAEARHSRPSQSREEREAPVVLQAHLPEVKEEVYQGSRQPPLRLEVSAEELQPRQPGRTRSGEAQAAVVISKLVVRPYMPLPVEVVAETGTRTAVQPGVRVVLLAHTQQAVVLVAVQEQSRRVEQRRVPLVAQEPRPLPLIVGKVAEAEAVQVLTEEQGSVVTAARAV